ncbi:MAG: DMT family transporter [Acidobacteria bacterium]|nr:DMT family transporter [Acidobacteriota bacterium]
MLLPPRLKADLALVGVTLIWGTTFVVIKAALADVSPLLFILLRFAIAAPLLLLVFGRRRGWGQGGVARAGFLVGAFLWAGFAFQTVGLQYTTPAKSAFLTAWTLVLVPVIAAAVFRQRVRLLVAAGVGAATLGVYLLTVPAGAFTVGRGEMITLFCTIAFAGHIVAVGHYVPRHGFAGLAIWQMVAALALSAASVPLAGLTGLEQVEIAWTGRLALALGVTAVLGTGLAFSVQTWAQQLTSPTHTALIYSLESVFAALTSYLVLGERLGPRGLVGAGLILAGVVLAELKAPPGPELPGAPASANPLGGRAV